MDLDVEEDEASRLLQALWRQRKARRNLVLLVRSIFKKHYDPASDTFFYVNNRTGESKWTKPALLGDEELDLEFPPAAPTRCNCMGRQFDASVWWVWEPKGPEGKRPDHDGFNIEIWRKEGNVFNHKSSKWVSAR